jgi:DNA-binding CsgD family transcriptional regulator
MIKEPLTTRQQEVFVYLLMGNDTREIQGKTGLSIDSVRPLIHKVCKFYNVNSRMELLSLFVNKDLLQEEVDVMNNPEYERLIGTVINAVNLKDNEEEIYKMGRINEAIRRRSYKYEG